MKKEMMAGILSLSGNMATTPIHHSRETAFSNKQRAERLLAHHFKMQSKQLIRMNGPEGFHKEGWLVLSIVQEPGYFKDWNLMKAEMVGRILFRNSTTNVEEGLGASFDEEFMFDLVDRDSTKGNTYLIYNCSSSFSACRLPELSLSIKAGKFSLTLGESPLDIDIQKRNADGGTEWVKGSYEELDLVYSSL